MTVLPTLGAQHRQSRCAGEAQSRAGRRWARGLCHEEGAGEHPGLASPFASPAWRWSVHAPWCRPQARARAEAGAGRRPGHRSRLPSCLPKVRPRQHTLRSADQCPQWCPAPAAVSPVGVCPEQRCGPQMLLEWCQSPCRSQTLPRQGRRQLDGLRPTASCAAGCWTCAAQRRPACPCVQAWSRHAPDWAAGL